MFPKITLDKVVDGIWIGDSNLFRPATSRRYLMGLSAYTGQPLRFVPALLQGSEIPGQFAASCVPVRSRNIAEDDYKTLDIYDECREIARLSFVRWLAKWEKRGAIEVLDVSDGDVRERMIAVMERYTKPTRMDATTNPDQIILAECLAADAHFIATDNFHTIRHNEVNGWAREKGRNHKLIGSMSELSELFIGEKEELAVVGAMVAGYEKRTAEEHRGSVEFFIQSLYLLHHNDMAKRLEDTLKSLGWEQLQEFADNSRKLSQTPAFLQACEMNDGLLTIKNQVVQEWEDLELGLDDENPKGPSL